MTSNLSRSRKARVLYGTETGTSQDLAEEIGQILQRQRFQHYVQGLDNVSPVRLDILPAVLQRQHFNRSSRARCLTTH